MLEEQLKKFGLSEKEAKTYLSLLELGESTVNAIAKKANVNRSSTYVVLEALQKKGLVIATSEGLVRAFKAAPPEKLAHIVEQNLKEHLYIAESVSNIMPSLKSIYREQKNRPIVKVFEGSEGIIQGFEDTILANKEKRMRVVSSVTKIAKLLPPTYFRNYVKRRHEAGVVMRGLHPKNNFAKLLINFLPKLEDETVYLSEKEYNFSADFAVYDNKIGYMSHEDGGFAIIIEDEKMAHTMKSLFDLAWKHVDQTQDNSRNWGD